MAQKRFERLNSRLKLKKWKVKTLKAEVNFYCHFLLNRMLMPGHFSGCLFKPFPEQGNPFLADQ